MRTRVGQVGRATHFVVPCGRAKQPAAAAARDLYTGAHFRFVLAAVEAEAEATRVQLRVPVRVWILSAKHGLVAPEAVLDPYDVTMRDPDSVSVLTLAVQALDHGLADADVFGWLPGAYRDRLAAALALVGTGLVDVYEAAPGIGHMRGVCADMGRSIGEVPARV